ncbi:MAG: Nif3-like dinuclear metal center hexameric protein [Bacteroidetes bacterium]|nr:Nif3-like dinuclear metal center hexameric protein [Bacteroidota bacterium]
MQLFEITAFLESIAPLSYQESYDNCGLLIGDKNSNIERTLVTLDVTEEVINEAIEKKCQLIVAHHPLLFSGLKRINGNNYVERCVIKAIKNDIVIYAIHTNLDNMNEGVNAKICEKLQLTNTKILQVKPQTLIKLVTFVPKDHAEVVKNAMWDAGAGNIGHYSHCSFSSEGVGTFKGNEHTNAFVGNKNELHHEPEMRVEVILPQYLQHQVVAALKKSHPYEEVAYETYQLLNNNQQIGAGMIGSLPQEMTSEEWLEHLKKSMDLNCIRYTTFNHKKFKRIAVCGGAGSFLLKDAIASGADAFVTGDFKYHEFFDAENKLMICDIGHYESERFTSEMLVDKLLKKFPTFAAQISTINTNPVNYYI